MIKVDADKVLEHCFKSAIIGMIVMAINYIGAVATEVKALNRQLIDLTYQIKSMGEKQNYINTDLTSRYDTLDKRVLYLENRGKK